IELIEDGGKVVQETRLYDAERDETRSMRSKEDANDYRYFPDPDLPPLVISPQWIEEVRLRMPELPDAQRARFESEYELSAYDAAQLSADRDVSAYFQQVAAALPAGQAKQAANWVMGELTAALNREDLSVLQAPVPAPALAALIARIADGTISNKMAREVFAAMWTGENGGDADAIIEARGLKQISDTGAIGAMIDDVLAAQPAIVAEYRAGKQKAFNSLVGQIMKAARGKANPQQVNDLLKAKLDA
ncbi:MAG: Asp-tRNA(Asn)/Glu-tRNA(Gln) amidotransferase GatCAB subunit B, partial [Burkholderiaceae bacterium]